MRQKRRAKGSAGARQAIDRHAAVIMNTIAQAATLLRDGPQGDARLPWLEQQLSETVDRLASELGRYGPFAVCEVARMNFLPWNFMGGTNFLDVEGGPARIELLALLAAASTSPRDADEPIWKQIAGWKSAIDQVIQLSSLVHLERAMDDGTLDPMAKIQFSTRAGEVLMRQSSYPEMVKITLGGLFDEPTIRGALISLLGFDLPQAIAVLEACDELQTEKMSCRINSMMSCVEQASQSGEPTPEEIERVRDVLDKTWDPADDQVSVSSSEVAAHLAMDEGLVSKILDEFSIPDTLGAPRAVADDFTLGKNILRTRPILQNGSGLHMLVHPALVLPSVRENFEEKLKGSPSWNEYQMHRGKYLEDETARAFEVLLPGAVKHSGFEYFIPANEQERVDGPAKYTKLVEGDLLFLLDDVAVIAEEKAVALASKAREGNTARLKSDLIRIITAAAEQADRLKHLIENDSGFRLRDGTWVDTASVREVHTVAVSLDDLSGVSTANADLLAAGLLGQDSIPWTVSLNDLRLIAMLVDDTAVAAFLLYLRRRRHPEATVRYAAVDELDFFLYFFENGLYVEPDPELMKDTLAWISEVRPGDRRRRERQSRQFIASHTDALDAWFSYENGTSDQPAPKPMLKGSPTLPLVRELQVRGTYGWCSLGATLLSGSTRTQDAFVATPGQLLEHVKVDGKGHHVTRPYGSSRDDAWVLVWAVEDTQGGVDEVSKLLTDYMRAKKFQLQVPRAAALIFSSEDLGLHTVLYEGSELVSDEHLLGLVKHLHPVDKWQKSIPKVRNRKPKGQR